MKVWIRPMLIVNKWFVICCYTGKINPRFIQIRCQGKLWILWTTNMTTSLSCITVRSSSVGTTKQPSKFGRKEEELGLRLASARDCLGLTSHKFMPCTTVIKYLLKNQVSWQSVLTKRFSHLHLLCNSIGVFKKRMFLRVGARLCHFQHFLTLLTLHGSNTLSVNISFTTYNSIIMQTFVDYKSFFSFLWLIKSFFQYSKDRLIKRCTQLSLRGSSRGAEMGEGN